MKFLALIPAALPSPDPIINDVIDSVDQTESNVRAASPRAVAFWAMLGSFFLIVGIVGALVFRRRGR